MDNRVSVVLIARTIRGKESIELSDPVTATQLIRRMSLDPGATDFKLNAVRLETIHRMQKELF